MATMRIACGLSYLDLPPVYGPATFVYEDVEFVGMLAERDAAKPEVEYTYPLAGATLAVDDPIAFTVTDAADNLVRVVVAAWMHATDVHEVVFDGAVFSAQYSTSTRARIANGYSFSVLRAGGWPEGTSVTMRAWAMDTAGNEENTPGAD